MAVDSSVFDVSRFNPLAGNRFETREDVVSACNALFEPLLPYFSSGKARVQIDASASTHDRAAGDLEGWARPLFGIVPMVAGGGFFAYWEIYREGLKNGTDPQHTEYWGRVEAKDQRHVEATAIGLALMMVPEHIWEPLDEISKANAVKWLLNCRNTEYDASNHMFFRVILDLGLRNVGIGVDRSMTDHYLDRLESLYIADGWYRDGAKKGDLRRIDWYLPWAMHFYGLLYAKCGQDESRAARFKDRATKFAQHFLHWFADTGSNIPYGRSLSYRHCTVAFWGALALADVEALPWGVIKGLYLRNLRWWSAQPISRNGDGLLTLGYAYPNQLLSERYCSPGSPWWSMKAFISLAVPANHPFWSAEELPIMREPIASFPISGMVFSHQPNHSTLFVSGPEIGQQMRGVPEKYHKFAYSSRYGFSVESDSLGFKTGAFDNIIAFSDDGTHYRVREHCVSASLVGNMLYSVWYPWKDVKVQSWIIPKGAWHIRIHIIDSEKSLLTIEGGFAVPRTDFKGDRKVVGDQSSYVFSKLGDFSGIVDVSAQQRVAKVAMPHGNTSVMFPRTLVPQLEGRVSSNTVTILACAVLASPDGSSMLDLWNNVPNVPNVQQCQDLIARNGVPVTICNESSLN